MSDDPSKRPSDTFHLLGTCFADIAKGLRDPRPYQPGACPFAEQRVGVVYSNYAHEFDEDVRKQLEKGNCSANHAAWNFHGTIWFDGQRWNEEIRCYRVLVETIVADSLQELIEESNTKYGRD